jgi:hypothetical protein
MNEGWHGDNYLVLFAESDIGAVSDRYGIAEQLPGYVIVGLRSWDDFIVRNLRGQTYTVPTVPLDSARLEPFRMPDGTTVLQSDERFTGKIKWYLKPLVFGGDPAVGENVTWVNQEQHAQLVKWWNAQYRALKAQQKGT